MKQDIYNEIVLNIRNFPGLARNCEKELVKAFPDISAMTLGSILSAEYQKRMKRNHIKTPAVAKTYYDRYINGSTILELSVTVDITPSLVARMILEHKYKELHEEPSNEKKFKTIISNMLKDTTKIDDPKLSYEVFQAVMFDNQYGPVSDCIRQSIGEEYEQRLKHEASKLKLCYRDENQLRKCGFDKTPDMKLEIPISVNGFIVNWIESKALFGDREAHTGYVRDQFQSYWNRFGPGMVIYWGGFIEEMIFEESSTMFIVRDHFPRDEIQCMEI